MIRVRGLSKQFGKILAVDDLSFDVEPGKITGFLGPNGAGKTTTMRMILGLDRPTSGSATIDGQAFRELRAPLHTVGALLDAKAVHPNRSARNHLLWIAQSNGIPSKRVDEVLELVGLSSVAKKRAGSFSLGMGQRLGLATALLGDPKVLLLDEPVNGLDPEGIRWVREFLRWLAGEGRTVLVSSHLLSEMALTADHLLVIGKGKLVANASTKDFIAEHSQAQVVVRAENLDHLKEAIFAQGKKARVEIDHEQRMQLVVMDACTEEIGALAFREGIQLHLLNQQHASLEDAFMEITGEASVHHSNQTAGRHARKAH
ncbi:ABC transporter ATP-binding protein [Corynebacterium gerontici]|uniref:Putative ABC transporter ATP-binding protein YxlF n=1 Tax=Corynebacterium gerontici TaxID=2079234 RepID=A0A3G6J2K7_9CORY|nr:ABC transporter ATP-binding protein [Corynebacterium gerontici]AZA10630.1 putative ABC transporter ATP-binding protein YxlF [Corynebacterium gerontici]